MNNEGSVVANTTLQVYALLFLLLGAGLGTALGFKVGAVSAGAYSDQTLVPVTAEAPKEFNWLFFEIGVAAGLIACAVLLASSFRTQQGTRGPSFPPPPGA